MTDILDITTLALFVGVVHLLQIIVLAHQYFTNKKYSGIGWWLLWSVAESIGFFVMPFRNIPGFFHWILLIQNTMIIAGTFFIYAGICRFFEKRINYMLVIPAVAILGMAHFYFLFIDSSYAARSVVVNIGLVYFAFLASYNLFFERPASIAATATFNGVVFLLHGGFFFTRAIIWLTGEPGTDFFSADLFNLLPFIDALIVSILWTFGLIIMVNSRLNADMEEERNQKMQIFSTSPDAAIITRVSDGLIVDLNEGYTIITGYTKEEIKGRTTSDINIWKNQHDRNMVIQLIRAQGYCENYEAVFVRKDGTEIIGLMSAKIIYLKSVPHIVSISKDITSRKQAEADIRNKSRMLEELNAEKDKFLSVLAHDLRNPFNSLLGLTQYLEENQNQITSEDLADALKMLRKSSLKLYNLLENLLEWSRIQRGILTCTPRPCHLEPMVSGVMEVIRDAAQHKKIAVRVDVPDHVVIMADEYMIRTVLRNLAFNAVKFTREGGSILLKAEIRADRSVCILVSDTGIGMPDGMVDQIFRFTSHSNRPGTAGEPSTGLGLIICKEFVEKHGSRICVESEEGKGSVFSFTLPGSAA